MPLLIPVPRHVRAQSAHDHVGERLTPALGDAPRLVPQRRRNPHRRVRCMPLSRGHVFECMCQSSACTARKLIARVDRCTYTAVGWDIHKRGGSRRNTHSHRLSAETCGTHLPGRHHRSQPGGSVAMSTPTITRARPVHAGHMHVAYELISQHGQLPAPTSVTVSTRDGIGVAVELTVDTASDVDAWAEAMNVEVDHELHRDGTWTDHAHGMLTAQTRAPYEREHIVVHVYSPQAAAHARTEVR